MFSNNSSSVQRATRINSIETARLQQTLRHIEQAKVHQSRLTNQDIKLTSASIDYIQSCSGHSPEARGPNSRDKGGTGSGENTPCFMYGVRIWSRKRKRLQRPVSTFESSTLDLISSDAGAESTALNNEDTREHRFISITEVRPRLSHGEQRPLSVVGSRPRTSHREQRPLSVVGCKPRTSHGELRSLSVVGARPRTSHRELKPFSAAEARPRTSLEEHRPMNVAGVRPRSSHGEHIPFSLAQAKSRTSQVELIPLSVVGARPYNDTETELDQEFQVHGSRFCLPRARSIPHQDWEDEISESTKKILRAQTTAQSDRRPSLYQSSVEVMSSQTSRNVQDLLRKIRISSTPIGSNIEDYPTHSDNIDKIYPPMKPDISRHGLGRRATLVDILKHRQNSITPRSATSQR